MSTSPTNNQGGCPIVNWIDSIDLSKYPELAQKVAAMNQIGLTLSENYVLQETMQAAGKFIVGSVDAGFDSAQATFVYGATEAGMGAAQAGGGFVQVKGSLQNIADIKGLQNETDRAMSTLDNESKAEENSLKTVDTANTEAGLNAPIGDGINAEEEISVGDKKEDFKENGVKLKSKKEIISRHETELERLRGINTAENSKGQILQNLSQTGQFIGQNAQANSQIAQMKQQVMNSNYSATQASAQSANQTLQQALQFDPYAQNVASSRA